MAKNWLEDEQLSFLDVVSIISFIIGYENYKLNIKQSDSLDKHLQDQDNKLLAKIINQNEQIIELLKEKTK